MLERLEEICFYSYFGNGDIFNTRGFIKELLNKYPNKRYFYAHSKSKRILEDLPVISCGLTEFVHKPAEHYFTGLVNDFYLNTWIGLDSKYVLPGIGCTLEMYRKMFNDIFSTAGIGFKFNNSLENYIPEINYSLIRHKLNVDKFIVDNSKPLILISNGDVFSCQSENFNFSSIIEELANRYKGCSFITTEKTNTSLDNIIYSGDITKTRDGFDLNEISYLSTKCSAIIGRSSGPYVFSQVKENLFDEKKIFISFTYHKNSSELHLGIDVPAKRYWSNNFSAKEVTNFITNILERNL